MEHEMIISNIISRRDKWNGTWDDRRDKWSGRWNDHIIEETNGMEHRRDKWNGTWDDHIEYN